MPSNFLLIVGRLMSQSGDWSKHFYCLSFCVRVWVNLIGSWADAMVILRVPQASNIPCPCERGMLESVSWWLLHPLPYTFPLHHASEVCLLKSLISLVVEWGGCPLLFQLSPSLTGTASLDLGGMGHSAILPILHWSHPPLQPQSWL